jgi:hypothetical protein
MKVTRKSAFTGITRTLDLPITASQVEAYYDRGVLLQNAFPNLTPDEREFIKTGVTAEEWASVFGED